MYKIMQLFNEMLINANFTRYNYFKNYQEIIFKKCCTDAVEIYFCSDVVLFR